MTLRSAFELRPCDPEDADRSRRHDRVLLEVSMCNAVTLGDLDVALREICTAAATALDVARASVWFFDEERSRLRTAVLYDAHRGEWLPPSEIQADDNPAYFAAVSKERVLAVEDACHDPRTQCFAATYLRPLGIGAMIDAPIRLGGRLLGVICCEHVGGERHWAVEEIRFAASLGDLVAQAVAAAERVRAEHALRESESRFRALVDGVRDVIFQLDRDGTILSLNPAFENLLGRRIADWVGRHFAELLFHEDRPVGLGLFERALSGETLPPFEIRLSDVCGRAVWFEFKVSALSEGKPVRSILGVGREIGARRETADVSASLVRIGEELIASVDLPVLLDRLCRLTADELGCDMSYTFLRDEDGSFRGVASYGGSIGLSEALRALPITPESVRGLTEAFDRDWVVISSPGDGLVAEEIWQAYDASSAILIALRRGKQLVGVQSAAFRGRHGVFGSREVRIAHGLARLASLALANARLVGELEAVNRLKSDFVAMMSHELRTPLNAILGYNEILLDESHSLDTDQVDALQCMRGSALQLLALVEATLDLSRLESGQAPLQLEDVDLVAWLHALRQETAALRQEKPHLSVEWHAPTPDSIAHTDALKLKIIARNLLSNAIKFTNEGSVRIRLSTTPESVEIAIRDTGIGISPKTLGVVFEPFRQGDCSLTRRHGGIGLGLYIVKRLVDMLAGRIRVESEPGRGSLFCVEIPRDGRRARPHAGGLHRPITLPYLS